MSTVMMLDGEGQMSYTKTLLELKPAFRLPRVRIMPILELEKTTLPLKQSSSSVLPLKAVPSPTSIGPMLCEEREVTLLELKPEFNARGRERVNKWSKYRVRDRSCMPPPPEPDNTLLDIGTYELFSGKDSWSCSSSEVHSLAWEDSLIGDNDRGNEHTSSSCSSYSPFSDDEQEKAESLNMCSYCYYLYHESASNSSSHPLPWTNHNLSTCSVIFDNFMHSLTSFSFSRASTSR